MKKILALVLTGILLLLSACAGTAEDVDLDMAALADKLLESGLFEETLNRADDGIAGMLYDISGSTAACLYVGSGAVADEFALFEFEDAASAREAVAAAGARVESQRESFAAYLPEEVVKLDNAVIKAYGRYLAVCISGGDGADRILSDFFEQKG